MPYTPALLTKINKKLINKKIIESAKNKYNSVDRHAPLTLNYQWHTTRLIRFNGGGIHCLSCGCL